MSGSWLESTLAGIDSVSDGHATAPVPDSNSVPSWRVALVCIGVAFTLTSLYSGSEIGTQLGLGAGIRAVIYGSLVLTVMSVPAAIIGARTRLSTYMIVSHVFGRNGARVVNLALAIVLLGWYAVTADLFGRTFYLTVSHGMASTPPQGVYTVGSSCIVVATTIFGFRAIDRLSLAAAPLLVALTAYVAWRALGVVPWAQLMTVAGTHVDLGTGTSAVIGGMIVNVVVMPDITRYSRTTLDCAVISIAGNGVGAGGALVLAMIPALAFHQIDPMAYMQVLGLAGAAFGVLVVSTWTINAVNLYSTGLVASTAFRTASYGRIVVVCGVVGTILGVIGIADRLIDFLVSLGLIVPPIAAVYLTDYYLLRRTDYSTPGEGAASVTNLSGLAAAVAGGTVGVVTYVTGTSLTGVPTIESFLSAALFYWCAELIRGKSRDRMWRTVGH